MLLDNENPTIIQTVFFLTPSLSYTFDVNNTIKIYLLKKMISAAAHLQKNSFYLYSEGKDYTEQDDEAVNILFPEKQRVVFTLKKGEIEDLDQSIVEIPASHYCSTHEFKYLSYYCYTCQKSICSFCILEKEHANHDYKEKYDYLQASKHLVDVAFRSSLTYKTDPKEKFKATNELLLYKEKLKNIMFKGLYELLSQIEAKFIELIDIYNKVNEDSCRNLQDNIYLIKNYCIKGLDQLKEDIGIHKVITDENVFLTFDEIYRGLFSTQNAKIEKDIATYNEFNSSMKTSIKDFAENTYKEIYTFLSGKLQNSEFGLIQSKLRDKYIVLISEKEVINQIIKNSSGKRRPYSTFGNDVKNNIIYPVANTDQKKVNYRASFGGSEISNITSTKNIQSPFVSVKTSQEFIITKLSEYVIVPIRQTKKVKVLKKQGPLEEITVNFPFYLGVSNFYADSAHCNGKQMLYISGGVELKGANTSLNSFFSYDYKTNQIKILPPMLTARHNHTMLYDDDTDIIYAIGGEKLDECERYSIENAQWMKLAPMNEQRKLPILYIHDNYLYAFFGKDANDKYTETVERLNLANPKGKWENIIYSNPKNLNLRIYGSAIACLNQELVFFGGKKDNMPVNSIFSFDFEKRVFLPDEQTLEWKEYFRENKLILIGDYHSQISEDNYITVCLQLSMSP